MKSAKGVTALPAWRVSGRFYIFLSSVMLGVVSLALPLMTLQVYDRILPAPYSGTLPVLISGLFVAVAFEVCLRLARTWIVGWNGAVYEHTMSDAAMRHILLSDISRTRDGGVGAFLNRMSSIARMKDFNSGYVLMTVTELLFVPMYLGVIYYVSGALVIVPLTLLLIFTLFSIVQGRRLQKSLKKRDKADDRRYDFLVECLRGIHSVKAFGLESLLSRRYETLQEKSSRASFDTAEDSTAAFNAGTVLSHLMMAAVVAAGAVFALNGEITTGALIASLQLSGRLMQPVQRVLVLWAKYQDMCIAKGNVQSLFALPVREKHVDMEELPSSGGHMSVRELCVADKLKNISFDLAMGDVMTISGSAGAGKTALLEVLCGLYTADAGEILIDGLKINMYPPEKLVHHVGYLSTEGVVFRGTIRDNMTRFGSTPEASARDVAALLGVDKDVARLPAGFDTLLHADGVDSVPPGLRHRIAMTRALATKPRIILFDEADRSLDRAGYNMVFSMLARLSRKTAMIIVSEDENLRSLATKRYVLRDGSLVEQPATLRQLVS
ncbi:MAG: ABC transporter transmembrane domain-containing protein [Alphaproteobacteria bacterium]|nr:ABC transporter transmembrane domain-containing protein [Alphaproteobacteria bacterium]